MAAIALEGVSKVYPGGVHAVSDLCMSIPDGELLVIVGPSGCGKTTTLRLLAGLDSLTKGHILIGGQRADNWPPRRRDVAMVFQRPALYPHRTVRDNLAFSQALRQGGWTRKLFCTLFRSRQSRDAAKELQNRVNAAAQLMGLEEVLQRRPAQLSGGQQQRVALGRALVRRPGILLLDEPLSNLDAGLRLELRRQLHLLHRRFPATMVYVTHDPVEALALGDRIAVLREGRLQQVGTPQKLLERPCNRFVAGFIGWPPMSFADWQLVRRGSELALAFGAGTVLLPEPAGLLGNEPSRYVIVGIRPEHVSWHFDPAPGRLPMQVARVETLGSGVLVTFTASGQQVAGLALMDNHLPVEEGQKVMVSFAANHVHLFDPATGLALRGPAG
jgi:multiple sugar transport system ATP-binding protein